MSAWPLARLVPNARSTRSRLGRAEPGEDGVPGRGTRKGKETSRPKGSTGGSLGYTELAIGSKNGNPGSTVSGGGDGTRQRWWFLWEYIGLGWILQEVHANMTWAAHLGVKSGDVIGYRVTAGEVMGAALGDLMNIETQAAPYPDPFK